MASDIILLGGCFMAGFIIGFLIAMVLFGDSDDGKTD